MPSILFTSPIISNRHRRLLKAVLASLLLHCVLLWPAYHDLPPRVASSTTPLLLRVIPSRSVVAQPASVEATRPNSLPAPDSVAAAKPTLRPAKPAQKSRAEKAELPVPPSLLVSKLLPTPSVVPAVAVSADGEKPPLTASSHTGAQSTTPANKAVPSERRGDLDDSGEAVISADALREYRISLASTARRFRRYPPLARERGWEGVAEVWLRFGAGASAPEVKLGESSGRAVLDDQAVDMIRQAARVSELPAKLQGRDFQIRMPVQFSLNED